MTHDIPTIQDMRPFVVTRRQVFAVTLALFSKVLLVLLALIACLDFYYAADAWGFAAALNNIPYWLQGFFGHNWPLFVLFLLLCGFLYRGTGKQKVVGITVRYGFDQRGIYICNSYGTSFSAWELFNSWREGREFILLNDGGRRILWPKAIWSEEELELQRRHMREKISSKRVYEA